MLFRTILFKREPILSFLYLLLLLSCHRYLRGVHSQNIPPTALVSYDFIREDCLRGSIPPSSLSSSQHGEALGSLILDPGVVSCPHSNGVFASSSATEVLVAQVSPAIQSSRNISRLTQALSSVLAIDLWLEIDSGTSKDATLLTIGSDGGVDGDCEYQLKLQQKKSENTLEKSNPTFLFRWCVSYEGQFVLQIPTADSQDFHVDQINRFVFNIEFQKGSSNIVAVDLIINGNFDSIVSVSSYPGVPNEIPSAWEPINYLWLLHDTSLSEIAIWRGTIYKLSMYDFLLNSSAIMSSTNGLVNSLPVAWNDSVSIQENGEAGSHYDEPEYYQIPISTADLDQISLPLYDLEAFMFGSGYPLVVYSSLPSKGVLYDPHSLQQIHSNMTTLCCTVKYRPSLDQYSDPSDTIFDFFQIHALDGVTMLPSFEEQVTVSIIVNKVNKPPFPIPNTVTVYDGVQTSLTLAGFDREDGEENKSMGSSIVHLPTHGDLHRQASNGSIYVTSLSYSEGVEYSYLSNLSSSIKDNNGFGIDEHSEVLGTDWFSYRLYDSDMAYSVVANTTLLIERSIQLHDNPQYVTQHRSSTFSVMAVDMTDDDRVLCLRITTASQLGIMRDPFDNSTLQAGDVLLQNLTSMEYENGIGFSVSYEASSDIFSFPTVTADGMDLVVGSNVQNDSFASVAFLCDNQLASSSIKTTPIVIQNVNDPTIVVYTGPDSPLEVYPTGVTESDRYSTDLKISGLLLVDLDLDVDMIRVDISTLNGGYITLQNVSDLDFISFEMCYGQMEWQCRGDGFSDRQLIFVGTPSVVQSALTDMIYSSSSGGKVDFVNISLYDGLGDNCFTAKQLNLDSIHEDCYVSSVSIEVHVLGYPSVSFSDSLKVGSTLFSTQNYALVGACVVLLCCFYRCCCYSGGDNAWKNDYSTDDSSSDSDSDSDSDSFSGSDGCYGIRDSSGSSDYSRSSNGMDDMIIIESNDDNIDHDLSLSPDGEGDGNSNWDRDKERDKDRDRDWLFDEIEAQYHVSRSLSKITAASTNAPTRTIDSRLIKGKKEKELKVKMNRYSDQNYEMTENPYFSHSSSSSSPSSPPPLSTDHLTPHHYCHPSKHILQRQISGEVLLGEGEENFVLEGGNKKADQREGSKWTSTRDTFICPHHASSCLCAVKMKLGDNKLLSELPSNYQNEHISCSSRKPTPLNIRIPAVTKRMVMIYSPSSPFSPAAVKTSVAISNSLVSSESDKKKNSLVMPKRIS